MNRFAKLGGVLGIVYCIAGFVLVFLGWNGAATYDNESSQIPYLISGGVAGLALVVVGGALIVAHSLRNDRVELRGAIDDLRGAVEQLGTASAAPAASGSAAPGRIAGSGNVEGEVVMAGADSYHSPSCTLIEAQTDVAPMSLADAQASDRVPCRVCTPGVSE